MKSGYIAIIGRPNAGKSTLLNRILRSEISIVTPKAQTTRERVLGILTESEGQIVFLDTPGIHKAKEGGINSYMMAEAKEALEEPDAIWYLVDPRSALTHEQAVLDLLKTSKAPILILINKCDLKIPATDAAAVDRLVGQIEGELKASGVTPRKIFQISALRDLKVNELLKETWALLPEGPLFYPDPDQLSDRPVRFFVSEKIREQLLLNLGDELPYSCAVSIESFEHPAAGKAEITRIEAIIYVERDSQKGMVIGEGGKKIKAIGTAARTQIEEFMGGKVFLGLNVKVWKDWSKDAEAMRRLGYNISESAQKRTKGSAS